ASPPCWRMMPAVPSPPAVSRSTTTTLAPFRAKPSAVARPIPLPPPVISATLPLKSMVSSNVFPANSVIARTTKQSPRADGSVAELAPSFLETGPDIGREGSCHIDVEHLSALPPQHDL